MKVEKQLMIAGYIIASIILLPLAYGLYGWSRGGEGTGMLILSSIATLLICLGLVVYGKSRGA